MTLYTLYIKSGINRITPEILNVFLCLSGHNASIYEDIKFKGSNIKVVHEYNTIEFHDIKTAQKVEKELREMFQCFIIQEVEFDKTGITRKRLVNITSFKETGKYYDNFNVEIPAETPDWNLVEAILKTQENLTLENYFIYHGYYANNVQFIIPAHMKASDMKPYVKLGESK